MVGEIQLQQTARGFDLSRALREHISRRLQGMHQHFSGALAARPQRLDPPGHDSSSHEGLPRAVHRCGAGPAETLQHINRRIDEPALIAEETHRNNFV